MADQLSAPTSTDMKVAKLLVSKIGETVDNFKLHALPLLSLYEQWKNLHSSFTMAETSLESRAKKLEVKEKLVCENETKFQSLLCDVKLREDKLKLEKEIVSDKVMKLDCSLSEIRAREDKLKLEGEIVSEKDKKLESLLCEIRVKEDKLKLEGEIISEKVKKLESLLSEIRVREDKLKLDEEIVREKVKRVELREKSVKECCEMIEMKNKEIVDRRDGLELLEKDYRERLGVLEFNEKDVNEALEMKERELEELEKAVELKKRKIEEQCRCLEAKEKELIDRCEVLELREKEIREEVEGFEFKRKGVADKVRVLEERKRKIEERCGGLEGREKEVEDRSRALESRAKEVRELADMLEVRAQEIVEGSELLEERKKGMEGASRELEGRVKELDERGKVVDLREDKIRERENGLQLKKKELLELQSKLVSKEKDLNKSYQDSHEKLKLKKEQLIESHRAMVLKEKEISDQQKELELTQESTNEKMKALKAMEMEISSSFKVLESKEKEINECLKAQEGQIRQNSEKSILVQKEVDGTKTIDMNLVELQGNKIDDCHPSVVVKKESIDLTVKQVEVCSNVAELEEEQISEKSEKQMEQNRIVGNLKSHLIRKCSSLFEKANEILKQDTMGKIVKDCCDVQRVKEEPTNDTLTLREKEVVKSGYSVVSGKKQARENPLANGVSSLFTELQSVIKNNDARATALYLIERTEKDSMWVEKMLGLRKEIPGLIQSLIAEHKHLQAVMCTCAFKMEDQFPLGFLFKDHLEYVRQRVELIVKEASATAQDEAANMELNTLRDVLHCINVFKLESKYSPAPIKLRITQLEREMKERTHTDLLMEKMSDHDSEKKSEALKSSPTAAVTPKPSDHNHSDSHYEKKRKASSSTSLVQNKHSRSTSQERNTPHSSHSPHDQDARAIPYINHVEQPGRFPVSYWPAYQSPPPGAIYDVPHDIGTTGRYGVAGYNPGVVQTPTLYLRSQGQRTEPPRNFINPHMYTYWRS